MKVLDLFSGIGGFSLGLERAGFTTVAFCEKDKFCQNQLALRWPGIPIHDDIRKLDGGRYRGTVELVCGGFPCQPFAVAGKRGGADDDRDLWPEMFRVVREVEPTWIIGENVAGFIHMELDRTLSDLESIGYACQTFDLPACGVDAKHIRHRVWIVAYADKSSVRDQSELIAGIRNSAEPGDNGKAQSMADTGRQRSRGDAELHWDTAKRPQGIIQSGNRSEDLADTERARSPRHRTKRELGEGSGSYYGRRSGERARTIFSGWQEPIRWQPEPNVGRVAHGIPNRMDRLRALGNSVVPIIPEILGRAILEQDGNER